MGREGIARECSGRQIMANFIRHVSSSYMCIKVTLKSFKKLHKIVFFLITRFHKTAVHSHVDSDKKHNVNR